MLISSKSEPGAYSVPVMKEEIAITHCIREDARTQGFLCAKRHRQDKSRCQDSRWQQYHIVDCNYAHDNAEPDVCCNYTNQTLQAQLSDSNSITGRLI